MNVELKHIKFFRQLSKETLCFSAKIYVDNKWLADCGNTGDGGMSTYHLRDPFNKQAKQKLSDVEDHFNQMPDVVFTIPKEIDPEENSYSVKMNLAQWIDMQVDQAWCENEKQRISKLKRRHAL